MTAHHPVSDTTTLTDVSDMFVVHRAFRRELALLPRLVRAVPAGDTRRAGVVGAHARLVLDGLHIHHTDEDALLWPKLLERAAPSAELVYRMEGQHHRVEQLVDRLGPALTRWMAEARPAVSAEVAVTVEELYAALLEHLGDEETHILPIAARTVTQAEWNQLGERGTARMTRAQLPLFGGMMLEEATPQERANLLAGMPAPVRLLMRTYGAWAYRRYVRRVRGGA